MEYYAKGIRKFQRELNISVSKLPQFSLLGRKSLKQIQKITGQIIVVAHKRGRELADYRLQELAEDPFRIEREPDLRKEQEEYFTRIRQEWIDPGSSE
jgi:hypothetical protein